MKRETCPRRRFSPISLPSVVVADANVVLSALIGGRARIIFAASAGPSCLAAEAVAAEIAEHRPTLAKKRGLDPGLLLAALSVMPVECQPEASYESHRLEAERRMANHDPEDWPTVALARSLPIWSQDKDMKAAGVTILTTDELLDAIARLTS